MRLLDHAFTLQCSLSGFRYRGEGSWRWHCCCHKRRLHFLPLSETKLRQWSEKIRRKWSWLRRKPSYRAFEHAVHTAFEAAWHGCSEMPHSTPNTALLVILGAVLRFPIFFAVATAMHAVLFAKLTSWPAWMQLLHPLATIVAKTKLLVLPVYPAAWPRPKNIRSFK